MSEQYYQTAEMLCNKLATGKISARDALEMHLERMDAVNPSLNAVVTCDLDGARRRADAADAARRNGCLLGPLHGLPMTIKESFDFEGLATTWGRLDLKGNIATSTAVAPARLAAAGANIFGKTNLPLMCADWQSFNEVYGTTNNPWDLTRVPGGSSGGSAAALAAGITPLELGSDIGASIRNPAHYCGVFGHKPTYGIIPTRGQATPGIIAPADLTVVGPMARSARDLALALQLMVGPDQLDARGWSLKLPPSTTTQVTNFRVAVMYDHPCCAVDQSITNSMAALVEQLSNAGAHVSDQARPDIDLTHSHALYIQLLRGTSHARIPESDFNNWQRYVDALPKGDNNFRGQVGRAAVQRFRDWVVANELRTQMRYAWDAFFEDYDVLICPAAASPAFLHDQKGDRIDREIPVNGQSQNMNDQLFWAGIGGVSYLPSTVAPIAPSADGLPIGVQIIGRSLGDLTTISFAECIEKLLGGFRAPSL